MLYLCLYGFVFRAVPRGALIVSFSGVENPTFEQFADLLSKCEVNSHHPIRVLLPRSPSRHATRLIPIRMDLRW